MSTLTAIIILIVYLPIIVLRFLLKHKALLFLTAGVLIFVSIRASISSGMAPEPEPVYPEYQLIAPGPELAPNVLRTTSRVYYVAGYSDALYNDNTTQLSSITLLSYYVFDTVEWQLIDGPLPIDRDSYGPIRLYTR